MVHALKPSPQQVTGYRRTNEPWAGMTLRVRVRVRARLRVRLPLPLDPCHLCFFTRIHQVVCVASN